MSYLPCDSSKTQTKHPQNTRSGRMPQGIWTKIRVKMWESVFMLAYGILQHIYVLNGQKGVKNYDSKPNSVSKYARNEKG